MDRRDATAIAALVGLCLVVFFFRLGAMALWDIDEGMHAATSKAMVLTGDWLTPRFNGVNFYDKPAFHNWLIAVSFVVLGFTETAARLPAAILGLGTVLLTFAAGRRMFGRTAGLVAGAVLATSGEFILLSRMVMHDISLTFAITAALTAFIYGVNEPKRARRRRWWLLFWAACGVAVLAKGPLGLVLAGLVVGVFLLAGRRWSMIRELAHPAGLLLFLAIAAPWYVAMSLAHDDYASYFFLHQNLGNFTGAGEPRHPRPWFYYLPFLAGGFFPWTCLLPLALLHAAGPGRRRDRDAIVLLLTWLGAILVFFSIATSKLATYILPLFPAMALLVGYAWHDLETAPTPQLRRGFLVSWAVIPLTCLAALGVVLIVGVPSRLLQTSGLTAGQLGTALSLLSAGGAAAFALFAGRRERAAFWAVTGMAAAVAMLAFGWVGPSLDARLSTKTLAAELDRLLPPGEDLVMYEQVIRVGDSALFYTDRGAVALPYPEHLAAHLAADRTVYCLAERDHLEQIADLRPRFRIVAEEGNKVILANRPDPPLRPRSFVREAPP